MGYDSKGILVFNLKYEHAISFINLVKFIKLLSNATVNIIHFPYLDLSQNVKIRDVPYSLKSTMNSECKLAHIYGMNKGKVFMSCVLYTNGYVNVNE